MPQIPSNVIPSNIFLSSVLWCFAPDLVSVSGAAPGCGAHLDGSYLHAPAEP